MNSESWHAPALRSRNLKAQLDEAMCQIGIRKFSEISPSLPERLNGTMRQRKTRTFAKPQTALDRQTQFFKSYYNLCRKHRTLKGEAPAQTAGLSDHTIFGERLQTRQTDNQFNEL